MCDQFLKSLCDENRHWLGDLFVDEPEKCGTYGTQPMGNLETLEAVGIRIKNFPLFGSMDWQS